MAKIDKEQLFQSVEDFSNTICELHRIQDISHEIADSSKIIISVNDKISTNMGDFIEQAKQIESVASDIGKTSDIINQSVAGLHEEINATIDKYAGVTKEEISTFSSSVKELLDEQSCKNSETLSEHEQYAKQSLQEYIDTAKIIEEKTNHICNEIIQMEKNMIRLEKSIDMLNINLNNIKSHINDNQRINMEQAKKANTTSLIAMICAIIAAVASVVGFFI